MQPNDTLNPYRSQIAHPANNLDERVTRILEAIRLTVVRRRDESSNQANMRHMEAFLAFLKKTFPAQRVRTGIQMLPKLSIRTTDRNYVVVVPGRSPEQIVMVAHYDTWAGFSKHAPGADDNKSGVEVLKHYLLRDLCAESPPPLTHVYLFSGSEECGIGGLLVQFALIGGLYAAGYAIAASSWTYALLSLLFLPLAVFRFGITGTKHFLKRLSPKAKASIRAAIAVDSVGEGRLYILENEMGANFIRALFPYEGVEGLNDLLEEGAHLRGIKFNQFLAGGTTDSVAFLEERFLWQGRDKNRIPAAALLTMAPGKASPMVIGGKLHTRQDIPKRVYRQPLKETLAVIDYARHILHGGQRPLRPRRLWDHHYARLYREGTNLFLALKDAVEPNRRGLNSIFRVTGTVDGRRATLEAGEILWWGVETTLKKEMHDFRPRAKAVVLDELVVAGEGERLVFARQRGLWHWFVGAASGLLGGLERLIGRYSFAAMFVACFLVAEVSNGLLNLTLVLTPGITYFVLDYLLGVFLTVWILQIAVLFRLFSREMPAAMDNAYKHLSRADNYASLYRLLK